MIRILLISDIGFQIDHFTQLFERHGCAKFAVLDVHCSPGSEPELSSVKPTVTALDINRNADWVASNYDLIISYHCRQLFPPTIVQNVRCLNIHPGLNPFNRGWYPGVFSIANGLPAGATIHEIDEKIDNGPIVAQKQVEILPQDTSGTVYPKIIEAEMELLEEWFLPIIKGEYQTVVPDQKGNLNYKKDFSALCKIDPEEIVRAGDLIDRLRALTHGSFQNAFIPITSKSGKQQKLFISLNLELKSDE